MKKLLAATLLSLVICCTGCISTGYLSYSDPHIVVAVDNTENLYNTSFGKSALIEIGDDLYYDSTTRIIYWWNGRLSGAYDCITPSPYYAPNGLPYKYNPEKNIFEEIELYER